MVGFAEAIKQQVRETVCRDLASDANLRERLDDATSSIPIVGTIADLNDDIGDALQKLACSRPDGQSAGNGVTPRPGENGAFQGGQCPDTYTIEFTVKYSYTDGSDLPPKTTQATVDGPISGPTIETIVNSQGNPETRVSYFGFLNGQPFTVGQTGGNRSNAASVQSISVTPQGFVDDCGNQDGFRPGYDGDVVYDDPSGNPVTEPYEFYPGPLIFGPGGQISAPVQICQGEICVQGSFNLSTGDVTIGGNGVPDGSPCCPPVGDDGSEDGPNDPPPPENDTRYVGVLTRASTNGQTIKATEIAGPEGPSLYLPRIGVVRFAIEIGGSRSYTVDQPIKQLTQFTPVNAPGFAYDWTIIPEVGFDITATGVPIESPVVA